VTNSYLDAHGTATNTVPLVLALNSKLVAMSLSTQAASVWTAEVRLNGVLVPGASLASGGNPSAYSAGYNIDFNAGDGVQFFCNGTQTNRPRVILWFARR